VACLRSGRARAVSVLCMRLSRLRWAVAPRPVWPALLAAWLLVLALEAAPHLVHHLLDEDPPTCGFLALVTDTPGVPSPVLDLPSPAARAESVVCPPQVGGEPSFHSPYGPRAPPPSCVRCSVV
jgi:hypothetical protein